MKGQLLLVEDDERVRAALKMILCNAGYGVTEAGSVATALMHLDRLDLVGVVLDLRLPNGLGFKVVDELREKRDDVPVIVMSAYIKGADDFEAEHGPMEWPVVEALGKPIQRTALLDAVRKSSNHAAAIRSMRNSVRRMETATKIKQL